MTEKEIKDLLLFSSQKARKEGLLSLECLISPLKMETMIEKDENGMEKEVKVEEYVEYVSEYHELIAKGGLLGEFLEKGLELITDGVHSSIVEKILLLREKAIIDSIQKKLLLVRVGILSIQSGDSPRMVGEFMEAITPSQEKE
ncbi:MAG: hypothetical protein V1649_01505 [Patescibacteria group bacterium]